MPVVECDRATHEEPEPSWSYGSPKRHAAHRMSAKKIKEPVRLTPARSALKGRGERNRRPASMRFRSAHGHQWLVPGVDRCCQVIVFETDSTPSPTGYYSWHIHWYTAQLALMPLCTPAAVSESGWNQALQSRLLVGSYLITPVNLYPSKFIIQKEREALTHGHFPSETSLLTGLL